MTPVMELEGTWEQILEHAPEFAGRRVRVTVLSPTETGEPDEDAGTRSTKIGSEPVSRNKQNPILDAWEEYERIPLTDDEMKILDGFERFRKDHPIRFRIPTFLDEPE